jgi:hypothetical protein
MGFLTELDLYDKVANAELQASTKHGVRLTLITCILCPILLVSELARFVQPEIYRNLSLFAEDVRA